MKEDLSLKILIVDDRQEDRDIVKYELFSALVEDFNELPDEGSKEKYMNNYKNFTLKYAIDLKEVLNILATDKDFDIITVDGNIGVDEKEQGVSVLKHLEKHYPELLKKTVAISRDNTYHSYMAKEKFHIKAFEKDMSATEKERFKTHIKALIAA